MVCLDCQTVVADLQRRQVGTACLLEEARKIITLVERNEIHLQVQYIPRQENVLTDALSRREDNHGLVLQKEVFMQILTTMGLLHVDAFANDQNAKLKRFFTLSTLKNAEGWDCFQPEQRKGEQWYMFHRSSLHRL